MAIALSSNELERTIEVLSSAAQALRLTRFERFSYLAIIVSVDLIAASVIALFSQGVLESVVELFSKKESSATLTSILSAILSVSIFVGIVSLALNIPLFRKVFRERARLKTLGLSSLSRSLWKESRRHKWISRAHGTLLIVAGILLLFTAVYEIFFEENRELIVLTILTIFVTLSLLFTARYLRNERERMDLTANAEELRNALQSLRQRAGDGEIVTVPHGLLEQTAKIESAQIAKERKDAVLQSIASPSNAYAVAFDRGAVEQRATLGIADRIELEDLVEQLSEEAAELASQAGAGATTALQAATESKRIEIDYLIDRASHLIRITALRPRASGTLPERR
jgi:hypothetical protein